MDSVGWKDAIKKKEININYLCRWSKDKIRQKGHC